MKNATLIKASVENVKGTIILTLLAPSVWCVSHWHSCKSCQWTINWPSPKAHYTSFSSIIFLQQSHY